MFEPVKLLDTDFDRFYVPPVFINGLVLENLT